jgi:type I restriction enzyme M protein
VIRLMVNLLLSPEKDLRRSHVVKTIYDPACGTGGMLSVSEGYIRKLNKDAKPLLFGQDWNDEAWAVCKSDMLIKGEDADNIRRDDTFTKDGFDRDAKGKKITFDYMLANPPFGVEWKQQARFIEREATSLGYDGRFGAGLPRINDGSLLFLQHMISKMRALKEGGSRIGIVFNGSPLFTGDAGSGESNIRQWIIENDWLEAVVALPDQLFYNTGISTYIWIVTNRKRKERRGKVQLINAVELFRKMRRNLGDKRHELTSEHLAEITHVYGGFQTNELTKIFDNDDFGYRQITVERPLRLIFQITPERIKSLTEASPFQNLAKSKKRGKEGEQQVLEGEGLQAQIVAILEEMDQTRVYMRRDEFETNLTEYMTGLVLPTAVRKAIINAMSERNGAGDVCLAADGSPEPDPELRDHENVPIKEDIHHYFEREVKPHVPDSWIDEEKTRFGYEIPFNRHFYKFAPLRPLEEIRAEIKQTEQTILKALAEVIG